MSQLRLVSVGALYAGRERGLASALLAARAVGASVHPVVTSIVSASYEQVIDVTDVPSDTVQAQLEQLGASPVSDGVHIGILAGRRIAETVLGFAARCGVPIVLDLQLSGPSGETVLTPSGIEAVHERLGVPDLVLMSRADAELFTGGEIHSLDDAQVAAHRLIKRGARAAVIRCGPLPARFFESEGVERPDAAFNADLYFDGKGFALFEAPHLKGIRAEGASSAFSIPILGALSRGAGTHEAIQHGKEFVTEALRATQTLGPEGALQYFWRRPASF